MIKLKAYSSIPYSTEIRWSPLGAIDRNVIHIGSIALNRQSNKGGLITKEKAMEILAECLQNECIIKVVLNNLEIEMEC